jgi:hypothetical protein
MTALTDCDLPSELGTFEASWGVDTNTMGRAWVLHCLVLAFIYIWQIAKAKEILTFLMKIFIPKSLACMLYIGISFSSIMITLLTTNSKQLLLFWTDENSYMILQFLFEKNDACLTMMTLGPLHPDQWKRNPLGHILTELSKHNLIKPSINPFIFLL